MSNIKVMSAALSSRIAAGEVIERPASVVKELAENSIDAGATMITVEIERAGIQKIVVRDNGCGMDSEDAVLCLAQHGTSKLFDESGMSAITTLGFRGEALPSIASVSKFKITTRQAGALEATVVETDGGENVVSHPGAGIPGTEIEVRNLFFNIPARRKFLKSTATEEQHIEDVVLNLALGHFEIGFELIIDGRSAFKTSPGGTLEYQVRELLGKQFADNMLPLRHRENGIEICGLIAAPGFTKTGRREQRVFVNRRAIEALAVYRGIRDGYATLESEAGRYPPVILFIDIDPAEVDVNVHPAKREVRFRAEFVITRMVSTAISAALRDSSNQIEQNYPRVQPIVSETTPTPQPADNGAVNSPNVSEYIPEEKPRVIYDRDNAADEFAAIQEAHTQNGGVPLDSILNMSKVNYQPASFPQPLLPSVNDDGKLDSNWLNDIGKINDTEQPEKPGAAFWGDWPQKVLAIYDETYLLCTGNDGIILVDQHAAHERIMFEKILTAKDSGSGVSQKLLFPETVELSRVKSRFLNRNIGIFSELGFDFESAGGDTILVNALPAELKSNRKLNDVLNDILDELLENNVAKLPVNPELVARAACRAAVKAHDRLSLEQADALIQQLKACRQGTLCPHGRPTMVTLTRKELEKRFARRQ